MFCWPPLLTTIVHRYMDSRAVTRFRPACRREPLDESVVPSQVIGFATGLRTSTNVGCGERKNDIRCGSG